jgi:hypothetical protein
MRASRRLQDSSATNSSCRALILSLHPDSSGFRELVDSQAQVIDWHWVLRRAKAHKVAALVAARMEECGLVPILDGEIGQRVREIRQEAKARTVVAVRTLRRLKEAFEQVSVPFFAIKGNVLAEHVYGDPSLRRFVDVDIVIRHAMLSRAEGALRSIGYRLGQVEELLAASPQGPVEWQAAEAITRKFYERFEYELPFYEPRGGELLPVDLHWHVARVFRLNVDAPHLWDQTIAVAVDGMPILTLNPPATLIHLSLHASTCTLAAFRLLHFCDVAWAAMRWRGHSDALWALAQEWGVAAHVGEVLETVRRVLGVPIPLLDHPCPPSLRSPARRRLTPAFLAAAGRDSDWSMPRRVWGELVWNVGMGCLGSNVVRSMRTRLARLQWIAQRWSSRRQAAA